MENNAQQQKKTVPGYVYIVLILLIVGMMILAFVLFQKAGNYASAASETAISAAKNAYQDSKEQAKKEAHEAYAEKAKEQYKVQVHSEINITSVTETAELNVLECQTSDYFYHEIPDQNLSACLKVTGSGKFKVNLKNAEYSIDAERNAVYVSLPDPVFEYSGEKDEEPIFFDKGTVRIGNIALFDGSTGEGEAILKELRDEAAEKLRAELSSDADLNYQETARESAKKLLTELIKAANPEVPDLSIEITFTN